MKNPDTVLAEDLDAAWDDIDAEAPFADGGIPSAPGPFVGKRSHRPLGKKERRELERKKRAHEAKRKLEQKAKRKLERSDEARRLAERRERERLATATATPRAPAKKARLDKSRSRPSAEGAREWAETRMPESGAPVSARSSRREHQKAALAPSSRRTAAIAGAVLIALGCLVYFWVR